MSEIIPPDFDKITWKCSCCNLSRTDKFIKVYQHDISAFYNHPTGTVFVNCKYCADVPSCKEKASDKHWVIKTLFPDRYAK